MAMELTDYFRFRCNNTLDAVRNIEGLVKAMAGETKHDHLKQMLKEHHDGLKTEVGNLQQITKKMGGGRKTKGEVVVIEEGQELIIVGWRWTGAGGEELLSTHQNFVRQLPQEVVDINNALLDAEITHFNLGNYTGLIVLAKQLGMDEVAGMLQQNIDIETHQRMMLEDSLWRVVAERAEMKRKAA